MRIKFSHILCGLFTTILCGAGPVFAQTQLIKTTFKSYAFHRFENRDILCEPYRVAPGDNLYTIFKRKGEISDKDFPLFLRIFSSFNPQVRDVNLIFAGSEILIPLKAMGRAEYLTGKGNSILVPVVEFSGLSPPKDKDPPATRLAPRLWEYHTKALSRYARDLNGTLSDHGSLHFPATSQTPAFDLDLSQYPLIRKPDGQRIIFQSAQARPLSPGQRARIQAHWSRVRFRGMTQAMLAAPAPATGTLRKQQKHYINLILKATGHTPDWKEHIPFSLNGEAVNVILQRVFRKGQPDLLINYGEIQGKDGVRALESMGYTVFDATPGRKRADLGRRLLKALAFKTWSNPSFKSGNSPSLRAMEGILAVSGPNKYFFTRTHQGPAATQVLKREKIQLHYLP